MGVSFCRPSIPADCLFFPVPFTRCLLSSTICLIPCEYSISLGARLGNSANQTEPHVTSLGVILDSDSSLKPHINKVTQTAFFHLRNVAKVQPSLIKHVAEKPIHAFITSRLDYCDVLFTGLSKKSIKKLELIQNSAARLLTKTKKRESISLTC